MRSPSEAQPRTKRVPVWNARGYIVLGSQKVRIDKPRIRTVDGRREVPLAIYGRLQQAHVIDQTVARRLV